MSTTSGHVTRGARRTEPRSGPSEGGRAWGVALVAGLLALAALAAAIVLGSLPEPVSEPLLSAPFRW